MASLEEHRQAASPYPRIEVRNEGADGARAGTATEEARASIVEGNCPRCGMELSIESSPWLDE